MKVFVKTVSGRATPLEVDPGDNIYRLKLAVFNKENISPDQQKLIFGG